MQVHVNQAGNHNEPFTADEHVPLFRRYAVRDLRDAVPHNRHVLNSLNPIFRVNEQAAFQDHPPASRQPFSGTTANPIPHKSDNIV